MKKHKTIRRTFCCILTGILAVSVLAGCGKKKESEGTGTGGSEGWTGMGKSRTGDNEFGAPSAFGTITYNDEKNPLGTPENTVDVQKLYNSMTYTPELFCGSYEMFDIKTGWDDPESIRFLEKCERMEISNKEDERHPTVTVSKLPIGFECMEGLYMDERKLVRTFNTCFARVQFLKPDLEHDLKYNSPYIANYKLDVEGNQIVLRRVDEINYIEETGRVAYTLTDEVLRYDFSFRGCDLTLTSDNGQSVILNSCLNAYCTEVNIGGSGYLKSTSDPVVENINSIGIYYYKSDSGQGMKTSFNVNKKDFRLSENYNGSVSMTDDGLMTLTLPPLKGEKPVTRQYLYFYLGGGFGSSDGGYILTDGTDTYYYTARYTEGTIGSAVQNLSVEDEEAAEKLTEEQLQKIEKKQADLLTDLGNAFSDAGLDVDLNPDTGEIVMGSNVLFGGDSAELTGAAKKMLATFAQTYASVVFDPKYDGFVSKIFVEGHTAPLKNSTYESGLPLSQERAQNVVDFCLSDEAGVDPAYRDAFGKMMTPIGYSCGSPIYQENGEPDLNACRRVAFRFQIDLKSV